MKNLLITGSSGFIGHNLADSLHSDYEVYTPSHSELNLSVTEEVEQYLSIHSFDVVIHCANMNSLRYGQKESPLMIIDQNLRMFWNLCRCANMFGKMLYFGSGAEFDMRNYIPNMSEQYFDQHVPQDSYGFSKYVMNQHAKKSDNIYNLRLFGVYGKYEEWHRRFISNNMCRVLAERNISINQDMLFDYLYIEDLCRLIPWFIEHTPRHHDYNICSGKPMRLSEIAEILHVICQSKLQIQIKKNGEKLPYTADNRRLLAELGHFEFTDILTGATELWKYYQSEYFLKPEFRYQLQNV